MYLCPCGRFDVDLDKRVDFEHLGVDYGKGRNTPLRISPVPFHDVENGCFTNLEVSGDPAVTSAFFGGLNDFGSDFI